MKALVKRKSEPGLWLEDVPEPVPGLNDVLIRIDRTGICGTDVHIYKWDAWAQKTIPVPMVVGHEFVGEIVEVGSGVKDFSPARSSAAKVTLSAAVAATAWPAGVTCAPTPKAWASTARGHSRNSSPCQ
jgi:threonine dehydrogenase-like Zn-dependent dehydrogenase